MKNTFKKIAASVMAVTTLVVSMTSFSANAAAEPRYGGSRTFSVGSYTATATIDKTSTYGYATTSFYGSNVGYIYVRVTVGSAVDIDYLTTQGKVDAKADSTASSASSYHVARTKTGTEGNTSMAA